MFETEESNTSIEDTDETDSHIGPILDTDEIRMKRAEKRTIDWRDKLMLALLTTFGNLPFRRICKDFGADITCSEMTSAARLLKAAEEEWALIKRHESEDVYGVQIAGNNAGVVTRCSQFLNDEMEVDFVDLNVCCPINSMYKVGSGCAMLDDLDNLERVVRSASEVLDAPFTVKTIVGNKVPVAHTIMADLKDWGAAMINVNI